jgi:hypothetical protein
MRRRCIGYSPDCITIPLALCQARNSHSYDHTISSISLPTIHYYLNSETSHSGTASPPRIPAPIQSVRLIAPEPWHHRNPSCLSGSSVRHRLCDLPGAEHCVAPQAIMRNRIVRCVAIRVAGAGWYDVSPRPRGCLREVGTIGADWC